MATIAGGSISSISGGKFANGAVTTAMSYAFGSMAQGERDPGDPLPDHVIEELEPYFSEFEDFDLRDIRVREGLPRHVRGALTYTSGNTVYFAPGAYDPYSAAGIALIGHEALHVQQFQGMGRLGFYTRYGREYLGGRLRGMSHSEAYLNISMERDAFALQARIRQDLIDWGRP